MRNQLILWGAMLSFSAAQAQCWKMVVSTDNPGSHTMAIRDDGTLWATGFARHRQRGDNDTTQIKYGFVQAGNGTNDWAMVATGRFHTLLLKTDGTLWSCGLGSRGCLGTGPLTPSPLGEHLAQVGTDTDWKIIAAGSSTSFGIKTDGTLWAWGSHTDGMLGFTLPAGDQFSPVKVGTDNKWAMISCTDRHTMAVKTDGTLWGWGYNQGYQIGDGTQNDRSVPTQIGAATDWVHVAANANTSYAAKTDGTLWAWGSNWNGAAANSSGPAYFTAPTKSTTTITNWKYVYPGFMGITTDGKLWAWGNNGYGEIGDSTSDSNPHPDPVQIGTETNWVHAWGEGVGSFAINSKKELYRWGFNQAGELGLPKGINSYYPVQLGTCSTTPPPPSTTVTNTNTNNAIKFYPNPTDGLLHIDSANLKSVRIANSLGQTWLKSVVNNSVDMRDMADGVYYLHDLNIKTIVVVKQSN